MYWLINDFVMALFASMGHCFFMCGGFIAKFNQNKNIFHLNLFYHLGKTLAYIFLGLSFSYFGNFLTIFSSFRGILFFFIGIFMMMFGIAFFVRGKFLSFFEKNDTILKIIINLTQKAAKFNGVKKALSLGFLNGFLPCGLVYVFLIKALTRPILDSVLTMTCLGFASFLVLIFFSTFLGFLKNNFAKIFLFLSSLIIFANGVYYAYLGLEMTR